VGRLPVMTTEELAKYISKSPNHNYLYHFTDHSNFPLISEHGLLSKAIMLERGVTPMAPGGNELSHELDRKKGIDKYVSLCFTRNHPMKYVAHREGRIKTPKYLGISPDSVRIEGVKIALGVSNANEVHIDLLEGSVHLIDLDVIYTRTNWSDPAIQNRLQRAEKYELLVPDHVPREMIKVAF
jgi:hypothetical protein